MATKTIKILLFEDNPSDVGILEALLNRNKDFSYDMESYARLSDGLVLINEKDFDVVLLDLSLPDSDKTKTLEKVLGVSTTIPIIVLTGLDDKKFALDSLQKGAQDYLIKGELNNTNLVRAILYAIERHKIEAKKIDRKVQKVQLDDKDKEILNILQLNHRIPYKELSKKVNLAASTIHNRVQNMLKTGIIKEFATIVDSFKLGYETLAVLGLSVDPSEINKIANEIANYDEVQLIASTTGDHDIIIQVIQKDEKSLWRFINENIKTIDGVKPQIDVSSFIDIFKMTNKIILKTEE